MPRHLSITLNAPPPPPHHSSSATSSAVILVIVIASAVVASAALYLLLRLSARRSPRIVGDVTVPTSADTSSAGLIESLPAFTYGAVTGNLTGGDCAVCLSKFERNDRLRLLPVCCHAFHAQCVDTWLVANQTCPLCRSTAHPTDDEVLNKILSETTGDRSSSFRIEIGTVSLPHGGATGATSDLRSYSFGDFDYVIDDYHELPIESMTHRRGVSVDKEITFASSGPEIPAAELAAGVESRGWVRDCVDRLGSLSFRSSGGFFTGSSRRSVAPPAEDMEEYRAGEEISELFRWLSGV